MSFKWKSDHIQKSIEFFLEHQNVRENRFHAVYFVDSITGALLLSKRYSKNNYGLIHPDDDLISNFLNAINMFIKEIGPAKEEEIEEINFKGTRIIYEKKGRLLCVAITKKTEITMERIILHRLLEDFYHRFEPEIEKFKGYIKPEILNYEPKVENLNSSFKIEKLY